ncbi:MAG: hypothetical protein N4A40_09895 [Tissierellales bacterium]|jgi:hypothetical protein|nr:hypothetical protein [Tissierellales bacterium]
MFNNIKKHLKEVQQFRKEWAEKVFGAEERAEKEAKKEAKKETKKEAKKEAKTEAKTEVEKKAKTEVEKKAKFKASIHLDAEPFNNAIIIDENGTQVNDMKQFSISSAEYRHFRDCFCYMDYKEYHDKIDYETACIKFDTDSKIKKKDFKNMTLKHTDNNTITYYKIDVVFSNEYFLEYDDNDKQIFKYSNHLELRKIFEKEIIKTQD